MIGIVVVTHGRVAAELVSAMEHVVGPQPQVCAVCVGPSDDLDAQRAEVRRCIDAVDTHDGVVLLTDMFGATPSNLCMAHMGRPDVEVLGGVNLPMLVKLAKVRPTHSLGEAVSCATAAGRKYIGVASEAVPHCRMRAVTGPAELPAVPFRSVTGTSGPAPRILAGRRG